MTPLSELERQYFWIEQNFGTLFQKCANPQEQDKLRRDYVVARGSYWAARNGVFQGNEPFVADVLQELKQTQDSIESAQRNLANTAKILDLITTGVRIGSSLVALGAAV